MNNAKNILVIRPDAIGDLVLTLPAIAALKDHFPGAKITALVRKDNRAVLENNPAIDQLIYDYDLKKYHFDLSVNFYNQFRDTFAVLKAGIPFRLGDSSRILTAWMNNLKVFRNWNDFTKHEVEFNLELLKPLGIEEKSGKTSLPVDPAALSRINVKSGDLLVGVHIGAATSKTWTPLGFSELVSWLAEKAGAKVVLLGGKQEVERGEKIALLTPSPFINLVGKIELGELMALTSRLKLFVGMDTGATHIAAALGIPLVMLCLTKRAKPLRWGPWQTRHLVVVPEGVCPRSCLPAACPVNLCAEQTSSKQVISAVETVLNGGGVSSRTAALYHWAQKSLGIAILYNDATADRARQLSELLQAGGYRHYLTKEKHIRQLLDFFICHDTLIIHHLGHGSMLAPWLACQFTGLHLASRALLIKDQGEEFKDCRELIDFYLRKGFSKATDRAAKKPFFRSD